MKSVECQCGKSYDAIGTHWHHNPSHRKEFSKYQRKVLTGILMGDGTIRDESGKNPYMRIKMKTRPYLVYIDNILGPLSTGVRRIESEGEIYAIRTRSHPQLRLYSKWYDSGKKVFPQSLSINPTILKHWYSCDGSLSRRSIVIGISNEINNKDKLDSYFTDENLPKPSYSSTAYTDIMRWTVSESKQLLSYMGSAVPGFEYKWSVKR